MSKHIRITFFKFNLVGCLLFAAVYKEGVFITEVERAEVAGVVLAVKQRGRVAGQQAATLRAEGQTGDTGTGSCRKYLSVNDMVIPGESSPTIHYLSCHNCGCAMAQMVKSYPTELLSWDGL